MLITKNTQMICYYYSACLPDKTDKMQICTYMQLTSYKRIYQMHTCIMITNVTIDFNYSGLSKSGSNKFYDGLPFKYQEPIKLILITVIFK